MTVRVTTLKGADAGAYYVELPSYYLDSGEPAGIWHGAADGDVGGVWGDPSNGGVATGEVITV